MIKVKLLRGRFVHQGIPRMIGFRVRISSVVLCSILITVPTLSVAQGPPQPFPDVADVTLYGAVGDGQSANNCSMSAGSNVVTCRSGPFRNRDIGKAAWLEAAGARGAFSYLVFPLMTSIVGFVSS